MIRFPKLVALGIAACLPMLAGQAVAQGAPPQLWGHGPMYGAGHPYGYGPNMMGPSGDARAAGQARRDLVDANDDGAVSAAEAAAWHEGMFNAMDANNDGVLDIDEFVAAAGQNRGYRQQEKRAERFREIDGDNDGNVTQAEFMAMGKSRFEAADGDGDGRVSVWEWRSAPRN